MTDKQNSQIFVKPEELDGMLDDLRLESIMPVLGSLLAAGFLLIFFATEFPHILQGGVTGLLLFVLAFVGWWASRRSLVYCTWMLSIGCLLVVWLLVAWTQMDAFLCLIIVPVGLAYALGKPPSGLAMGGISTMSVVLFPAWSAEIDSTLRAIVIVEIWLLLGLMWLAVKPLYGIIGWSWSNYKMNRSLVEEVRATNLRAQETIKDLDHANLQLTRLNKLTHSMRLVAEEARRAKEQFVANVSHELRTPLNMIIGFSEMILQSPKEIYGGRVSPKLLADLDVILRNSRHLSKLVDDVLDLSQMDAGQTVLNKTLASMKEIILTAANSVQPLFQSKNLFLNVEIPEDLPPILCDVTRIRQVVLNLLSNAGRFTEQGGVTVNARYDQNWMTVSVTDTGLGIAEDAREQLFQPFHQMDASFRDMYGGSGLGLSISKKFIEMHDGRIGLESEEKKGSTFYFQLPITQHPVQDQSFTRFINFYNQFEPRTHPIIAPKLQVPQRFVVLENGQALDRLLSRYMDHVEIVRVSTMQEAVQELEREPAQALLINDLSMSDALYSQNNLNALPADMPVIVCAIPGIEHAIGTMGVKDYLIKPISRDTLLLALTRLNLKRHTLLIADDEEDSLRLFRRMLLSSGVRYTVLTAKDGEEALKIMREQHPDGMLMDLTMPVMDGFQLLAEKARDPAIQDIPVIVISARDPTGQPIVSKSLTLTQNGGLSLTQVLACINAFGSILSKNGLNFDLKTPEDPPDSPAS